MSRSPSLCGVILAAGESNRMGSDKALLAWPPGNARGATFLSAAIEALAPWNDLVLVVTGSNRVALEPVIYSQGAFLIENPRPELGQFSSLQVGLREVLNRGRDAAMITLVDRPPVQTTTLEHLVTEFPQVLGRDKWALVPEHNGKHGHPFLAAREMIEAFLRAPATSTARDIEHQNQKRIAYLPIEDPWVVLNVNTPEDYANLPAGG